MAQILRLTEAASLALHAVSIMTEAPSGQFTVKELAERSGASGHHLAKVMQRLAKAGILHAMRGPHGGYSMARPLSEVTLLEVYEAIEGQISGGACPLDRAACPFESCVFGGMLHTVNLELAEYFSRTTLETLSHREER